MFFFLNYYFFLIFVFCSYFKFLKYFEIFFLLYYFLMFFFPFFQFWKFLRSSTIPSHSPNDPRISACHESKKKQTKKNPSSAAWKGPSKRLVVKSEQPAPGSVIWNLLFNNTKQSDWVWAPGKRRENSPKRRTGGSEWNWSSPEGVARTGRPRGRFMNKMGGEGSRRINFRRKFIN